MGCKLCMMAQYGVESWFKKTTFQPGAANRNSQLCWRRYDCRHISSGEQSSSGDEGLRRFIDF